MERLINKIVSRKLLVWVVGTIAMFTAFIDTQTWMILSIAFIGSEGVTNMALVWKGIKTK